MDFVRTVRLSALNPARVVQGMGSTWMRFNKTRQGGTVRRQCMSKGITNLRGRPRQGTRRR